MIRILAILCFHTVYRRRPDQAKDTLPQTEDVRPQFLRNLVQESATALRGRLSQVREEFEAHYGA